MEVQYSAQVRKASDPKKLFNVQSFSELDRTGLAFGEIERRLLMKEFPTGEKLYIQYPGKESARIKSPRPWDFRPRLYLPNGERLKDLSFKDVWDDLYALKDASLDMGYLATLFFRIAYMLDTELVTRKLQYEDIDVRTVEVVNTGELELSWYEYAPSAELLSELQVPPEAIRGCSLPAYLAYNDYLAQNEGCKYFYRATYERNEKWDTNTGRRNTLLTHMSVIAFIEGLLSFTDIVMMFQRGKGVAALPSKYWEAVTGGRVTKG